VSLRSVLLSCLAVGLVACRATEPAGPWQRFDLTLERPSAVESPFVNKRKPAYEAGIGYLGAKEVRDLALVPPETFANFPHQAAGQVRVLDQVSRSRLSWSLTLGREAYLAFTPLVGEAPGPASNLRVELTVDGKVLELASMTPPASPQPAPEPMRVELGRYAGKLVTLTLAVEPPPGTALDPGGLPWARWASPAVYQRGAPAARKASTGPPNVLLIGADTLRADHVGAFTANGRSPWGGPSLTPALDALAAESDVWLEAFSTFNVTNPSFASILTGLYGKNHGVYDLRTPLPAELPTLAEIYDRAGYDTLSVISARHLGPHNSALGRGFDQVLMSEEQFAAELPIDAAMDWIGRRGERPFFAWLHLFDPHTPHTPPDRFARGERPSAPHGLAAPTPWLAFRDPGASTVFEQPVLAGNRWLYAGEVAYLDRQLDRLLDFLASRGLLETTWIVVVADHGENLTEHGILYRHGGLWDTTTHVPLLVRAPGSERGRRFSGLVQTIDLFPTLLRATGQPIPAQDGFDLYELTDAGQSGRPAVFSEHASQLGVTVRTKGFRYMKSAGNPMVPDGAYFYDLAKDPREESNLAGQGHPEEQRLADLLDRWLKARRPAPGTAQSPLTEQDIQRLRALGYL
jgi:arylsulfatase